MSKFVTKLNVVFLSLLLFVLIGAPGRGWGQTTVSYTGMGSITCPAAPTATISPAVPGLTFSQISRGSGVTCGTASTGISGSGFNVTLASALSGSKWYTYSISSDASVTFTVSSISVVSQVSAATGSPSVDVQYSIGAGSKTSLGSFTPTTTSTAYTITPGSPISVGVSQTINIFIVPNTLTASTTTCRVNNNSSITVTTSPAGNLTPPTLNADATNNNVDNNIDITFTDDATWRAAVTAVKIGGTALTLTTDYVFTAGNLQLKPSGGNALLTTSGSKAVTVDATGYSVASVTQIINPGADTKLGMKTQPTAPVTNGAALATQPAVYIQDQYGNTTTSTSSVVAAVGAGTWTLGGTTSVAAVAGTTTYSGLTATSAAAVTGATIAFTSGSLTGVTSGTFNIPAPPPPALTADITNNNVDNAIDITFTDNATWRAAVTAVKIGGTALTVTTDYVYSSGNLQLKPSGLNALLTSSGSKAVTVEATGYSVASVTQMINAGATTKLGMKTQPTAPASNAAVLATQPAVYIQDQYGNTTTSTASVVAAVGAGTWTLGGTTSVAAVAGTTTYSGLTATSAAAVTGATISFTSAGLTPVTSATFNIPAPPPPALTADVTNNDVDNAIDITFTDNATWRAAVTAVKIGGTAITVTTDYVFSSGNLQLKPSGLNALLTTSGSKAVTVEATGYSVASVTQMINAGAATKLGMKTQPTAPASNGAVLATQPAVYIQDQYGNTTTSTSSVVAAVGAGTWTLGGTTSVAAVAGTTAYIGLTATSPAAVTGATIAFTSGSLTGVTSSAFDITAPLGEPTNHPGSFTATPQSGSSITVTWTDATGGTLPENYLIKASTTNYAAIVAPADGTPVADGALVKNIAQGVQTASFTGLNSNTPYYFKIYPYTNSGGSINFKTDGTVPQATATTPIAPETLLAWQFGSPESTGTESTYNATTNNSNLNTSTLSRGNGITATALARGFSAKDWDVAATKSSAITNNEYFQFTINAKSGYKVSLSTIDVTLRRTSAGPNAYIWKFSLDGSTFTEIGTDVSFTSTVDGVAQTQLDLSGISAIQNITDATTITLRIYAWGSTATTGTFAIARYAAGITTNCLAIGGQINIYSTTFSGTGNWNNVGNWSNGIPTSTIDAIIDGAATIDIAAETKALVINSGKSVTISNTKSLTVSGTLTNTTAANLVVNSGGSLIQGSANVAATVQRSIPAWVDAAHGWHFLSSPVTVQAVATAFTTTPDTDYDFYAWWEPTNEWVNFKNVATATPYWSAANTLYVNGSTVDGGTGFIPGKGYLAAYAATSTRQFAGTLNKDNIGISNLAISAGNNNGWHLLGNPFTSAITWGTGWTLTHINATAKIWNVAAASYADISTGGKIPALNGFMVQVVATFGGNNSLTIPISARTHDATAWYKSTDYPHIVLVASDPAGQTAQESVIRFDEGASAGFDAAFDSHFLPGYAPWFYSVAGDEHLSTNSLPEAGGTVQIPVSFVKNDGTSFTIKAKTISGLFGPVILNDLKTNTSQDLTLNPDYSFTSTAGDDPNRFLVTFHSVGINEAPAGKVFTIYTSGNNLYVTDITGKNQGIVYIYNLMGQLLSQQNIGGNVTKININAPTGYYLVKVVTSEQAYTTKVFIK